MTFAEMLRELRDAAGLSEAKLAVATGMPVGTIHNYALGRRAPSFSAVVRIAKALGVTCEAFAECEDIAGDGADEEKPAKPAKTKKGKK
jgi:transcriptional regulator with XRE-family HTH domain